MTHETFRSRFGLIISLIGMAVGTGNIWRFPRVMSANGGAAFLIPWAIFLFIWSIPLLIVEFSLGQKMKRGVVGCFHTLSQGRLTWLGGFVVICTLGIMFYYSVVTGWCLFYLKGALTGEILRTDPELYWTTFSQSNVSPLFYHAICIVLSILILQRGIRNGIEFANSLMLPTLYLLLIGLAIFSLTLPGREKAMEFLFKPDFSKLLSYKIWLEALTQSAWSTGAGWGIALTYACHARDHDDPVKTPFITAIGNNSVEFLAALVIMPTLFSFFDLNGLLSQTGRGNTGLTFIVLPNLFRQIPGGQIAAIAFFIALFFAALTSLFSMLELGIRFLEDHGLPRTKAVAIMGVLGFALGIPSALNMHFLDNQDWVWGIGLLLSGFFFTLLMRHIGMPRFVREFVPLNPGGHQQIFKFLIYWLIPFEFLALVIWWFYQAISWDTSAWWNPFKPLSVGTCIAQWGILLTILYFSFKRSKIN